MQGVASRHKFTYDTLGAGRKPVPQGGMESFERPATPEGVGHLQVAVYVMCGGGFLGRSAAEQPAEFYIDTRCSRLPYPRRDIMQMVATLVEVATLAGMDPKRLPEMPDFHGGWVF